MPVIPSFDDLVALEPLLADLLAEARSYSGGDAPTFCASAVWYGRAGLLKRLLALVSPESGRGGLLGTYMAFAVAYDTLSEALPPCRGVCACAADRPGAAWSPSSPLQQPFAPCVAAGS
jgi:hypothetical protein